MYWNVVGTDATVVAAPLKSPRSMARALATVISVLDADRASIGAGQNTFAESNRVTESLKFAVRERLGCTRTLPTAPPNGIPLQNDCERIISR